MRVRTAASASSRLGRRSAELSLSACGGRMGKVLTVESMRSLPDVGEFLIACIAHLGQPGGSAHPSAPAKEPEDPRAPPGRGRGILAKHPHSRWVMGEFNRSFAPSI